MKLHLMLLKDSIHSDLYFIFYWNKMQNPLGGDVKGLMIKYEDCGSNKYIAIE